jgi:arylsulfatase
VKGTRAAGARARGRRIVAALALALVACHPDPDATPRAWRADAEALPLPVTFDLRDHREVAQWRTGPGVAEGALTTAGWRLSPEPGRSGGFFAARPLPLEPGQLGTVDVTTAEPAPPLAVGAYLRGRVEAATTVIATPDPDDPRRQRARFREGRWNHKRVEGLRIAAPADAGVFAITSVTVTHEKYAPVATPRPDADWARAFAGKRPARNAIVLLADTLRADHLSLYGYPRPTTPRLEVLARHGVVFEAAWSQAACTFPSVNSLLTSRLPAEFLGEPAAARRTLAGRGALAERLAETGFATAAVSASWVVRATPSHHNDWGGGYGAGFETFDETCAGQSAACVNDAAVRWLDDPARGDRRFLLYLHYLDPHDPYRPPAEHPRRWTHGFDGTPETARGDPNPLSEIRYRGNGLEAVPEAEVEYLRDLYDEEIRYLDRQLALLFEALRRRDLLRETVVVLASDHGESFLDHGHLKHCRTVYEDQVRTPLVVWAPGTAAGTRPTAPVQNLDIAPTLLDLLGVAAGPPALAGRSLRPALESGAAVDALAFSAQDDWLAASDGRFKWIENARTGVGRLYDLADDPGESENRARRHPAAAARLVAGLRRAFPDAGADAAPAEDARRRLERLGYLE